MGILKLILIVCGFTGSICTLSRKKFGECLPLTQLLIPIVLFFSQFLYHTFNVGYGFIIVVSVLFVPLYFIFEKKSNTRNNFFSNGFWIFLIIVVFFCILDYRRYFSLWDELSHWGMMTKEMLRLDNWYSVEESRLLAHKDYPPFISLYEMFFCKIYGGYSEPRMYLALHIFQASFIAMPLVDHSRREEKKSIKKLLNYFIIFLIFIVLIECFDIGQLFNSIYKDIIIAVMFAYSMFLIWNKNALEDNFYHIILIFACTGILLTKQMGILFLLLIWFYYSISYFMTQNELRVKIYILKIVSLILCPMLCSKIWQSYIQGLGISGQFELSKISVTKIIEILNDSYGNSIERQTLNNFCKAIFDKNMSTTFYPITYLAFFMVLMVVIALLMKINCNRYTKSEAITLAVTFVCGTFGYAFTMLIIYLFCYSETEMLNLASYERYMGSYIVGELILISMIFFEVLTDKKMIDLGKLATGFVVCVVCTNASNLSVFEPGFLEQRVNQQDIAIAEYIDNCIDNKDSIFILCEDMFETQLYVNYYSEKANISLFGENILEMDFEEVEQKEIIEEIIFSNQYLYVEDISDEFNEKFSYKNNGMDFCEGELYLIGKDGNTTMIER